MQTCFDYIHSNAHEALASKNPLMRMLAVMSEKVGKAKVADIKLKGLFAPKVAAMVNRSSSGYFITPVGTTSSRVKVNGDAVSGRHKLEDGDIVEVCKTSFQFYLVD